MSILKANRIENLTTTDGGISIDNSGQIGVGSTSPSALLHIAKSGGNAKLLIQRSNTAADTNDYGSILWQSSAGNNNALIGAARHSAENDAYMFFSTASGGSLQEELRIQSAGGISFNGDTAQANALDDYEEGDWTPAITFGDSSTGITHNHQVGRYTKIGRVVLFQAYVQLSNKGSASGTMKIGGLPYTSANVSNAYSAISLRVNNSASGSEIPIGYVNVNDTRVVVNSQKTDGTGVNNWTNSSTNNNTDFILNGHYIV